MNYQWLLFDADGTLFDYDQAEAAALKKAFESFGGDFQKAYAQSYRKINALIWHEFERGEITQVDLRTQRFARLFEAIDVDFDPQDFSQNYLKFLGEGAYLMNGAQEILEILARKVELMLITNGLKDVQRARLARSTIQDYFKDVVISEEVGAAKPDERIFEAAFQKMGNPNKKDVLIIGDSLTSDMRGGNLFGIDTCWFNPEQKVRDQDVQIRYEIANLIEILPIVGIDYL